MRGGGPIFQSAAACRGIPAQLARDRRRGPPELAGNGANSMLLNPARWRSLRARQTIDHGPIGALKTAKNVTVACRLPSGTNGRPRPATPRHRSQLPHSNDPPQPMPKTADSFSVAPAEAVPATATLLAQIDPNGAFQ